MAATAWDLEADTVKQLLAADRYRDEYTIQLHQPFVPGENGVYLGFGEDAVDGEGVCLGSIGHTSRVLGAKARLSLSAVSGAAAIGGIETHTSLEYRHVPSYPYHEQKQGSLPVPILFYPPDGYTGVHPNTMLFILFNVEVAEGVGNFYIHETNGDALVETIAVGDAAVEIWGGLVAITPTTLPFDAGTGYYVLADAGVLIRAGLGPWGGFALATDWNFETLA